MLVPGGNILNVALGAVRAQLVGYRAWQSRAPSAAGTLVNTYADRATIAGSIQPIGRTRAQMMGLDLSKSYAMLYAPGGQSPVSARRGADRFDYGGRQYDAVNQDDWVNQDGWNGLLLVDVGAYGG